MKIRNKTLKIGLSLLAIGVVFLLILLWVSLPQIDLLTVWWGQGVNGEKYLPNGLQEEAVHLSRELIVISSLQIAFFLGGSGLTLMGLLAAHQRLKIPLP